MIGKILVSACLTGAPVRYDGRAKAIREALLDQWRDEGRLVIVCPEVAANLCHVGLPRFATGAMAKRSSRIAQRSKTTRATT